MKMLDFGKRVICALAGVACALSVVSTAHGQSGSAFWNAREPNMPAGNVFHQDWMRQIPDDMLLKLISIPGTHDSMTYEWDIKYRWLTRTQSMGLRAQLDAGIRALDIRLRIGEDSPSLRTGDPFMDDLMKLLTGGRLGVDMNDSTTLLSFHGPVYLRFNFNDVLRIVNKFLQEFPSETVLMRIKDEGDSNRYRFEGLVWQYVMGQNSQYLRLRNNNPTLGEARGKIVILDDFSPRRNWGNSAPFNIQDDFEVAKGPDGINQKWPPVLAHIDYSRTHPGDAFFINFLSASGYSGGIPKLDDPDDWEKKIGPSFYAYGQNKYTGLNVLFYDYVASLGASVPFVGIVFADFPGSSLITQIINTNFYQPYIRWTGVPGLASAVAIGANGQSWVLGRPQDGNREIWRWTPQSTWERMPGAGVRIAADANGQAWVVNKNNELWYYANSQNKFIKYSDATDIAVGSGEFWKIGSDPAGVGGNAIYRRRGDKWEKVGGAAVAIAIERAGMPWVLNRQRAIFRFINGNWKTMPGAADAIAAAEGHVFVISGETIFKWSEIRGNWHPISGRAKQIAVRPDGVVLVVNASGQIFTAKPD